MTMKTEKFAVLILTHGRADNVVTYETLRKKGYTGPIYIVIDDEDEQAERYNENFGRYVVKFDKEEYFRLTDTADNGGTRHVIVAARNAGFDIARRLGLDYFVEMDDDYDDFQHRYEQDGKIKVKTASDMDAVFDAYIEFLESTGALTVCFAQGGDYIGGLDGGFWKIKIKRKGMNAFFCKTDRPFEFLGRINEDVNTYTVLGNRGELIFTAADFMLHQKATQSNPGGMTTAYLESGTFLKSFYSCIFSPQAVKVKTMGPNSRRIHHAVDWNLCAPMILSEKWRKVEDKEAKA